MKWNKFKKIISVSLLPTMMLVACTNNDDGGGGAAVGAAPIAQPQTPGAPQDGAIVPDHLKGEDKQVREITYNYVSDGCETGNVKITGLGQIERDARMCEALMDGSKNNNCAVNVRKDVFEKMCAGMQWKPTDTKINVGENEENKELLELRKLMTSMIAVDSSSTEGEVVERSLGQCGFSDDSIKCLDIFPSISGGGSFMIGTWEQVLKDKIYARSVRLTVPNKMGLAIRLNSEAKKRQRLNGHMVDVELIFAFDLKKQGEKLVPTKLRVYEVPEIEFEGDSLKEFFSDLNGSELAEIEVATKETKSFEAAVKRIEDVTSVRELYHLVDFLNKSGEPKSESKARNALSQNIQEALRHSTETEYSEGLLMMAKRIFSGNNITKFLGLCEDLTVYGTTIHQGLKDIASTYVFAANPKTFGEIKYLELKKNTERALKFHRLLEVRVAAAEALAKNGEVKTSPVTQQVLLSSLDDVKEVKDISKAALSQAQIKVSTLRAVVASNAGQESKLEALRLLSEGSSDEATAAVGLALKSNNDKIRDSAKAILESKNSEVSKKLLKDSSATPSVE